MEKELNREQIIKALECCTRSGCSDNETKDCPLKSYDDCRTRLAINALALIEELTEENERLEAEITHLEGHREADIKAFKTLKDENERLKLAPKIGSVSVPEALEILNKYCESGIKKAKADTVRKMQERLTERLNRNSIFKSITMSAGETVYDVIDQIAKEMLEGENNG